MVLHGAAIWVIYKFLEPIFSWYLTKSPIRGVDTFLSATYVHYILKWHEYLRPAGFKYFWFGGYPFSLDYPSFYFLAMIPFVKKFGSILGVLNFAVFALLLLVVCSYLLFHELSKNRAVAVVLAIAVTSITHLEMASSAGSSITGTVKVTGMTSSADVVVYIQEAPGTFAPPSKPVDMDQIKMQFIPRVLPVVAGTTVRFLNSDPTPHNVFSPDNEKYNLGTWPKGQSKTYAFTKCGKTPCVYIQLCRVHPDMEGFVIVLQNSYFAVTDKGGRYEIGNVPPGNYTLAVWQARTKAQPKPVTVDLGKSTVVDFTLAR